jgi:hypothetical protein
MSRRASILALGLRRIQPGAGAPAGAEGVGAGAATCRKVARRPWVDLERHAGRSSWMGPRPARGLRRAAGTLPPASRVDDRPRRRPLVRFTSWQPPPPRLDQNARGTSPNVQPRPSRSHANRGTDLRRDRAMAAGTWCPLLPPSWPRRARSRGDRLRCAQPPPAEGSLVAVSVAIAAFAAYAGIAMPLRSLALSMGRPLVAAVASFVDRPPTPSRGQRSGQGGKCELGSHRTDLPFALTLECDLRRATKVRVHRPCRGLAGSGAARRWSGACLSGGPPEGASGGSRRRPGSAPRFDTSRSIGACYSSGAPLGRTGRTP